MKSLYQSPELTIQSVSAAELLSSVLIGSDVDIEVED